jgi:SAM-dependent methyltransferase
MADFFTARLDMYEAHMLRNGDKDYRTLAGLVPENTQRLLDLGCGTGLELDWIFKRLPDVSVTGIDLMPAMLYKLRQKYPDKKMELVCGNYFEVDLGTDIYDTAVSCATLHHFLREPKTRLYKKILKALKSRGVYIESDYMVNRKLRDELQAESARVRREQNIPDGEFYHLDIPYTVENQVAMLKKAGFSRVDVTNRGENGAIIIARK